MDDELAVAGPAWDFGLKLFVAVRFDEAAATARTLFGEGSLQGFIKLLERRRPSACLAAR